MFMTWKYEDILEDDYEAEGNEKWKTKKAEEELDHKELVTAHASSCLAPTPAGRSTDNLPPFNEPESIKTLASPIFGHRCLLRCNWQLAYGQQCHDVMLILRIQNLLHTSDIKLEWMGKSRRPKSITLPVRFSRTATSSVWFTQHLVILYRLLVSFNIETTYSHNKSQWDALLFKFILIKNYMFRKDLLSIIRSIKSVYTAIVPSWPR